MPFAATAGRIWSLAGLAGRVEQLARSILSEHSDECCMINAQQHDTRPMPGEATSANQRFMISRSQAA